MRQARVKRLGLTRRSSASPPGQNPPTNAGTRTWLRQPNAARAWHTPCSSAGQPAESKTPFPSDTRSVTETEEVPEVKTRIAAAAVAIAAVASMPAFAGVTREVQAQRDAHGQGSGKEEVGHINEFLPQG